jgi:hypothetical protein
MMRQPPPTSKAAITKDTIVKTLPTEQSAEAYYGSLAFVMQLCKVDNVSVFVSFCVLYCHTLQYFPCSGNEAAPQKLPSFYNISAQWHRQAAIPFVLLCITIVL